MKKLGKNKDDQKKSNWGLVLKLIATKQCTSRIDLAKATGLTKTAISQIVGDMMEHHYIEESEKEVRSEIGRYPTRLIVSADAPKVIGVLIERTYCAAVLCDLNLQILRQERVDQEWGNETELLSSIYCLIDHMLAENVCIASIGVAAIGPVNVSEGKIVNPYFFHNIHDVEIRRPLEERYKIPVYFDHDNQSAALAEFLYGNGRNYQDIFLVGVARGVGCGIIVQGHRIHSSYGYAPEIGHISIDHHGETCVCGNRGCLELYTNSDAMTRKFRKISGKNLEYAQFMMLTDEHEIDEIMQECIGSLTAGLISVLNILNSQIVLLGMDCCSWPDRYIRQIEAEINRVKFGNKNIHIPVKKTYFMENSQLLGAACNALNGMFHGETGKE